MSLMEHSFKEVVNIEIEYLKRYLGVKVQTLPVKDLEYARCLTYVNRISLWKPQKTPNCVLCLY